MTPKQANNAFLANLHKSCVWNTIRNLTNPHYGLTNEVCSQPSGACAEGYVRASLSEPRIHEKPEAVYYIYLFVCDLAWQRLNVHAQTPRGRPYSDRYSLSSTHIEGQIRGIVAVLELKGLRRIQVCVVECAVG